MKTRKIPVRLTVIGAPLKVRSTVEGVGGTWIPWTRNIDFREYDCLLHPARDEPYGMVVSEARLAGCHVLCSDRVGSSELYGEDEGVQVVPLDSSIDIWVSTLMTLMQKRVGPYTVAHSWQALAKYYQEIYRSIVVSRK